MTRKHARRRPRQTSVHMLINRGLKSVAIETEERMLVEAFVNGYATTEHYDCLVDMRNVLMIAGNHKDDKSALAITEAMRIPLANLRERYAETGRMFVDDDEAQVMRAFIDYYADFWLRQPVALYEAACDELDQFKESLKVAA